MRYFFPAHPSVRLFACSAAGIMAAVTLPLAPSFWLGLALVSSFLAVIMLLIDRKRLPAGGISALSVLFYLVMVFSAFAFHASAAFRLVPSPSLISLAGRDVILLGFVEGRPVDRKGITSFGLRVTEVFKEGKATKVGDRAKVIVRRPEGRGIEVEEGDFIRVKGRLDLIAVASNRGEYDPRLQNRMKGVHVQLFCAGPWRVLREMPKPGFSFIRNVINPLRNYLSTALDRHVPDGEERQFVKGMILGERDMLSEELYDAFRRTGTAHVLAVSGLHVALLAYAVNLCLQRLKVTPAGRWLAFLILVSLIGLYSFVTGNAPSIKRAAIMSGMMFGGGMLGRKSFTLNSLAASDLVILLFDPFDLFNPGFVMTNGAVLGILTIHQPLSILVPESKRLLKRSLHLLWSAFTVSISAMIGVSPVIALYFGTFSLSGLAANLPAVLFSNFAMYASLPLFLFHGFAGWLASLFGMSTWLFARLTLFFVYLFSGMPLSSVEIRPDLFDVVVFYLSFAAAFHLLLGRRWMIAVIAVLVGMNLLLWHEMIRPVPKPPEVLTVNIGKEVAVLFSSGSETCLVDAGRREGSWERIRRQSEVWGLEKPMFAAPVFSDDSVMRAIPLQQLSPGSSHSPGQTFVVRRVEDKALRIDSRARSLLLVSGLQRLERQRADGADVVLWIYRFTGKEWHRLDAWMAEARPGRMLIVPGTFMSPAQHELLKRFAKVRSGVEVRSKSHQTVWY
jgi:competence protein ComEC